MRPSHVSNTLNRSRAGLNLGLTLGLSLGIGFGLAAGLIGPGQSLAKASGLNSENFYPAIDNQSGVMWETAKSIPARALLLGYTFSYALRPVEFGDGKSERIHISDHLQVNHFAAAYGLLDWLDVGLNVPIALYSAPSQVGGYLANVGTASRNFFFLGDVRARAKASFFPGKQGDGFYAGAVLSANFPTGSSTAMLSDDTTRLAAELPMHVSFMDSSWEAFFTPGAAVYGSGERVTGSDPATGRSKTLLEKSNALLLNGGARYWLAGSGTSGNGIQIEGGLRGDFAAFKPTLNGRGSPVEWSAGGLMFLSKALSVHGGYGTGIGSGATAPMSRLVAGVRWLNQPAEEVEQEEPVQTALTSQSYTDRELDKIFEEAQREAEPPRLADEETMLRLMTQTEVIDIGAVRFEFDSARLTADAKKTVLLLHEQLLRVRPKSIKIDGHTDSVGSYKYNLPLSKRRADSVRNELIRLGQNASMFATEGFAFKYPVATNANKRGRAMNRRIEVAVDGKSFRKTSYTKEETEMFRRWIYPNGKQPNMNQDSP